MRAKVNEKECVGCGLCADTCPSVFRMDGSVAKVMGDKVPADAVKTCKEAAENCPVSAIAVECE